jgi:hypothetical protein
VADHPLRPATDRRLGRPLPHQLANRTQAPPPAVLRPLTRRCHAVLAPVSRRYPPPVDRSLRVTHPSATAGCPAVRLACVKHAASVRSEPGSNSQVHHNPQALHPPVTTNSPTQPPTQGHPQVEIRSVCQRIVKIRQPTPFQPKSGNIQPNPTKTSPKVRTPRPQGRRLRIPSIPDTIVKQQAPFPAPISAPRERPWRREAGF